MSFFKTSTLFLFLLSFTSCVKQNYHVFGSKNLPSTEKLTSFAFAGEIFNQPWTKNQEQIFKEMQRRNYFYDNESPEVLVFVDDFPKGVSFLTGNEYKGSGGKTYLESTKVKTREQTLFIQLVETQKYQTFWRGFSYANSRGLFTSPRPVLARAILNQ